MDICGVDEARAKRQKQYQDLQALHEAERTLENQKYGAETKPVPFNEGTFAAFVSEMDKDNGISCITRSWYYDSLGCSFLGYLEHPAIVRYPNIVIPLGKAILTFFEHRLNQMNMKIPGEAYLELTRMQMLMELREQKRKRFVRLTFQGGDLAFILARYELIAKEL